MKISPIATCIVLLFFLVLITACETVNSEETNSNQRSAIQKMNTKECLEETGSDEFLTEFKNIVPECRDTQIISCRNIKNRPKSTSCLLNLAGVYSDGTICKQIDTSYVDDNYQDIVMDSYWICQAYFNYGESACSNIKNKKSYALCIAGT